MGYVLAILKFFLSALRSIKHYVNVTPPPYVSRLSDHTVYTNRFFNRVKRANGQRCCYSIDSFILFVS